MKDDPRIPGAQEGTISPAVDLDDEWDDPAEKPASPRGSTTASVTLAPPEPATLAPGAQGASASPSHAGAAAAPQGAAAQPIASSKTLMGPRKAAIFILSLDEDDASLVLRNLSDDELSRVASEIARLGVVQRDAVASVIREYREQEQVQSVLREGGLEQAARLVERSFPAEKARRVLQHLSAQARSHPFAFLEGVAAETLLAFLQDEHPQTLAAVLAHMSPSKAAEVLEHLAPEARKDVLERIADLEGTNAEALAQVEQALEKHLDAVSFQSLGEGGGVRAVAEILRAARDGGTDLLDDIRQERPELADEIGKHLFVFDDLVRLDDRAIQEVLKEIETRRLALALKTASPQVKAKVFNNLSRRAAEIVREEMEFLGPVRFVEVETARRSILETILRLEGSGQLSISGRGREENRIVY